MQKGGLIFLFRKQVQFLLDIFCRIPSSPALFLFSFLSSHLSPYYVCGGPADMDTLKIEIQSEK